MRLLAVDTSTKVCGAALVENGRLVCETNLVSGRTHSERLMPLVDGCLRLAGWAPGEIDVFAVVAGPGSFTGIRIGVSAVKGMAAAQGKPVVAVDTLAVLASSLTGAGRVAAPLLDARRGQVYCALYGDGLRELLQPCAQSMEDLLQHPFVAGAAAVVFAGDGVEPNREAIDRALGSRAAFAPPHLMLQRAGAAAHLAWRRAEAGLFADAGSLAPLYLRKSSAEQKMEAGDGR